EMGGQPLRVLDLCGAPGGKSTDIMAMLRPQDLLVSNEVIQSRAGILREVATKWGYPNHLVTNNDPADFQRLPGFFDLMVVDAPCSGEGMFRKDEQAIREWSPAHVELCAARQQRILADVWDALREGGILLYSTCTFNRRENEEILARLRAKHEVTPVTIRGMEAFGFVQSEVGGIPLYRAFPHRIRGEGFSFFVLRKTETGASTYIRSTLRPVSDRFEGMALDGACYAEGDNWVFRTHAAETETLKKYLKMIRSGVEIGTWKKDKLIPSGEWALSHHARLPYPTLSLDRDQALAYMRKEAFELPSPEKGFYLVTYRHLPLGFINHLGNRFNNLFPTNWRIRSRQSFDQMPVVSDLF
ncbi:MAG: hypothetical protein OEY56_12830, partial [Cyclobacteriaceae bacterium]|nr:hypothetical protein [Cyclobacteriaceae bacterium]